jgi:uncharacterized protein (TIGR01370 family)
MSPILHLLSKPLQQLLGVSATLLEKYTGIALATLDVTQHHIHNNHQDLAQKINSDVENTTKNEFIASNSDEDAAYTPFLNELLYGSDKNDLLAGGKGDDMIFGLGGNDTISGGAGKNVLKGDHDNDVMIAGDTQNANTPIKWGLLYYGEQYTVAGIKAAPHDLLVINPAKLLHPEINSSEIYWSKSEIAQMQSDGKSLFGYVNLAEYSRYLNEWQDAWDKEANRPDWILEADTPENITYRIDFTDKEFQTIVLNRVGAMIDQGFDGTLLDDALEYYFRIPKGLEGQEHDDAVAAQATNMQKFILDIRAFSDAKVLARDGVLNDSNRFELMVNGAPFITLDAVNTELSAKELAAQQALNTKFIDAIDYQLVENYISLFPEYLDSVSKVYHGKNTTLLSIDTDLPTDSQKVEIIKAALDAGFSPYVTDNNNYNILNDTYNKYINTPPASENTVEGGQGTDTIIPHDGTHEIDGGSGVDVVDYSGSKKAVDVNLKNNSQNSGAATSHVLHDVENVIGTKLDDKIYGDDANNSISGGAGDDIIAGRSGEDTLSGELGDDKLQASSGDSLMIGGAGHDTISGGSGKDTIIGKDGKNFLTGGTDEDTFVFEKAYHNMMRANEGDVISDFTSNEDKLDVSALPITKLDMDAEYADAKTLRLELDETKNVTHIISDGLDFSITLVGDHTETLTQDDFIF